MHRIHPGLILLRGLPVWHGRADRSGRHGPIAFPHAPLAPTLEVSILVTDDRIEEHCATLRLRVRPEGLVLVAWLVWARRHRPRAQATYRAVRAFLRPRQSAAFPVREECPGAQQVDSCILSVLAAVSAKVWEAPQPDLRVFSEFLFRCRGNLPRDHAFFLLLALSLGQQRAPVEFNGPERARELHRRDILFAGVRGDVPLLGRGALRGPLFQVQESSARGAVPLLGKRFFSMARAG